MRQTRRTFIQRGAVAGAAVATSGLWLPGGGAFGARRTGGVWLPGDLHTHSTYSHDVYGGPTDDNTGPDEFYTAGLPVAGKVLGGPERGLRFIAGSDYKNRPPLFARPRAEPGVIPDPGLQASETGPAPMIRAGR